MNELIPLSNGMLIDSNGITRPPWACANDLLREYYDTEWGREIYGEQAYFERLCLESFQQVYLGNLFCAAGKSCARYLQILIPIT